MAHKRKKNQKVGNLIPSQYVTQLGHLVPLPTMEGKLQSIPLSSLMGIRLKINNGFPRFQQASKEVSTPSQHSDELRQMNQCPPRDAICHIKSNICIEQNIYFMDAD